jgi:hypothetical protein
MKFGGAGKDIRVANSSKTALTSFEASCGLMGGMCGT